MNITKRRGHAPRTAARGTWAAARARRMGDVMAMLRDVYDSLQAMSLLHLLLAFVGCTGYLLAQGRLAPPRLRAWGACAALGSTAWFVIDSPQWTAQAMLVALAIGAVGVFSALAWGLSALLGLRRSAPDAAASEEDESAADAAAETAAIASPGRRAPLAPTRPGPLHSH